MTNLLTKQIMEASQKYYSGEDSGVDDATFDKMLDKLKEEDPDSPLLAATGHGYDVNRDSTPGAKVKHKYGNIGSLDKGHDFKECASKLIDDRVCASLKLDGISVVLYYKEGHMYQALTRGSNNIGIDITEFASYILKDDVDIEDKKFTGAVRGEVVMSNENFEQFKIIHPEAKNARNSTAGLKNSNKITSDLDYLDIVVYTVVGVEHASDIMITTRYNCMIDWLDSNFQNVVPNYNISIKEDSFFDTMCKLADTWYNVYPADGIVLTDKYLNYADNEVKYNAIAFKFKAESAVTDVLDVEWNLSKTKYLVPRIHMNTVSLSGTNVSYCTGHNAKFILDNKIGIGASVEIYKSGEIIPYLDKVIEPSKDVNLPEYCPACGEKLEWNGVHLMCPNKQCGDFNIQDLLVWMENIAPHDGLGDTLKLYYMDKLFGDNLSVDSVYEKGDVNFNTSKYVKENEFHEMYHKLFHNKVKLCDAIKALNIPRFGDVTSKKLAEYPEEVKHIIRCATEGEPYDSSVASISIGDANMKSLFDNYSKFKRLGYILDNIDFENSRNLKGNVKVAITGKLSVKRAEFEKELASYGYVSASISKDTQYLITDNPDSSSDKNKKADKWGIVKITEHEFRDRFMNMNM